MPNENSTKGAMEDLKIVAIGASAGGLEALKLFFDSVPFHSKHSFIIVQHLSPDYKSLMAELLAKNTVLPIFEVENDMLVEEGCIYLIPPKKNMTIMKGKLLLVNKPASHDLNLPIDIFFRSLAQYAKERAVCIVLSGTGSDGTSGARAIKEAGGLVMVQDPQQAKFDGMPRSAINTGLVDYTLPVEALYTELLHYTDHPTTDNGNTEEIEQDENTVKQILMVLQKETRLDFGQYKLPTLVRRIARRIIVNKFHNQNEYLAFIRNNSTESNILAREFLIGVTNFFRDPHVWETLEKKILPDLIAVKKKNDLLKVWCVGSSTGEEAYTMAMLIAEESKRQKKQLQVKIFATDLSVSHLEIGSRGVYPESIIANVSPKRLKNFFIQKGDEYQVNQVLRKMVIFSQHNVLYDPPFNKMDISVCRNLLIYMQKPAQRKIIGLLHYSLNLNGILVLGSSESLGDYSSVLEEYDRKCKIYRNIEPARTLGLDPLNYPDTQKLISYNNLASSKSRAETKMADVMNETVAEELGLAGVYIDETYNILHAVGEFRKFIALPDKGFSSNLLKLLSPSVSIALATTVRKAFSKKQRMLHKGILMNGGAASFDLLVNPFEMSNLNRSKGCLLLFMPKAKTKGSAKIVKDMSGLKGLRITELEGQLKEAKESLHSVIEEVETSNEELQATNEELLAANEELQSTNEELQSVNEELYTVNAELQQKIEDVATLNNDMDNLLTSTNIGTIFLDKESRIRKFTPAIMEHFKLRESDVGRPITHFSNSFGTGSGTLKRVNKVIKTGKTLTRELQTEDGKWFLKRITPFVNTEKTIQGAVLSFVDINKIKKAEEVIKSSEEEFRLLYDNAPDMFASMSIEGKILNCNARFIEDLGLANKEEALKMAFSDFQTTENEGESKNRYNEYRKTGKLTNANRTFTKKDGTVVHLSVNAQMLYDAEGKELYTICSFRDVSDLKNIEKKYLDKNNAFEQLLEGTMAGYWDWKIQEGTEYLSPSFKAMFGYKDHEMENKPESWQKILHPEDAHQVTLNFDAHVASKAKVPFSNQVRYYHKDGSMVWIYCRGKVIEWDSDGKPVRMVGSHVDITPIKNIEQELYRSNRELEKFAYVASHDLQEPLNTIMDFVQLLDEEFAESNSKDAKEYIQFIVEASSRMKSLVKSVLDYSKIGRNPEKTKVDCNTILGDIKVDLKQKLITTKATLKYDKLPVVNGTITELHSLFINLVTNAIKFRREDVPPIIKITSKDAGTHWQFSIEDNGIGVAKEHRERVFNIFQRLNNMDSYEGTGIGLAQCKKIVQLHKGKIWISGTAKNGTTFNFTLIK